MGIGIGIRYKKEASKCIAFFCYMYATHDFRREAHHFSEQDTLLLAETEDRRRAIF